ncbi:hypothetical protein [Sphingomonas sp. GC_Shp_3]|nr:hypothetical protein [Sphingomonas sp. GC_Shp_3]
MGFARQALSATLIVGEIRVDTPATSADMAVERHAHEIAVTIA